MNIELMWIIGIAFFLANGAFFVSFLLLRSRIRVMRNEGKARKQIQSRKKWVWRSYVVQVTVVCFFLTQYQFEALNVTVAVLLMCIVVLFAKWSCVDLFEKTYKNNF